jgi:hypothetical protein
MREANFLSVAEIKKHKSWELSVATCSSYGRRYSTVKEKNDARVPGDGEES